jgi:hypothetical protein|nr:MAG TPA: Protein of unknown function (DUF1642) [Caudoviricetes sp.]
MSDETKRDVFEQLLKAYQDLISKENDDENYRVNITTPLNVLYDDALPYDLPVIPKAVGRMITKMKPTCNSILASQYRDYGKDHRWIIHHYDTFARAWLLEAWIVEETGKIVKVEDGE